MRFAKTFLTLTTIAMFGHAGLAAAASKKLPAAGADPAALQNESAMSIEAGSADGFRLRLLPLAAFGPGYAGKTRKYRVVTSTSLTPATWQAVPGYESISGDNIPIFIPVTASTGTRFYRAVIWLE